MVRIVDNVSPLDYISNYDIILCGTNCYQTMRNGFQGDISNKFPFIKEENYKTKYADPDKLGTILECKNENVTIILMFITFGYNFHNTEKEYIDYGALQRCLNLINLLYPNTKICSNFIGLSKFDGNGDKEKLLRIMELECKNVTLDLFNYPQKSWSEKQKEEYYKKKNKLLVLNKE